MMDSLVRATFINAWISSLLVPDQSAGFGKRCIKDGDICFTDLLVRSSLLTKKLVKPVFVPT